MSNELQTIKTGLMAENVIALFADNLPNVAGKQAIEAARRYAKMLYTTICNNPTLQQCSFPSIVKAGGQSASLGLDVDVRGLAYLVPYKNKGVLEAQLQIGYLGLIELAYRSGKVKAISAHCIYESEKATVQITRIDGQYKVKHPFSYTKPTGKVIAVYATAEVEGVNPQTVVLRADEIEHFRKMSKAPNSPAWKDHYEAMSKKTAIRQLSKFLPKSILEDFARGAAIDEHESFVEAQVTAEEKIKNEAGSEVIDAEFEEKKQKQLAEMNAAGKQEPEFMQD